MESELSRRIKFGVLVSLQIPSLACYCGLLHHYLGDRQSRAALQNHAPLALLIVGLLTVLVDLSLILDYLRMGVVSYVSDLYCQIWNFLDLTLYALVSILMLWSSIERHIIIFHSQQLLGTRRQKFFVHYLPLIIIFTYLIFFYIYIAFIHACTNKFDFHQVVCAGLCFVFETPVVGVLDQFLHTVIPSILIVIINMALWLRVLWQKYRHAGRIIEWKRQRKMVLQFLPMSTLYSCGYLPFGILQCYQAVNGPTTLSWTVQQGYFFYLFYLIGILHPFACLVGMPDVYKRWFQMTRARIGPATTQMGKVTVPGTI